MKVIEKLEKLGDEFKETMVTTAWFVEYVTDFYNGLLGYPWGGLILWIIVSIEISTLLIFLRRLDGI